jgi:hypothetical protein
VVIAVSGVMIAVATMAVMAAIRASTAARVAMKAAEAIAMFHTMAAAGTTVVLA